MGKTSKNSKVLRARTEARSKWPIEQVKASLQLRTSVDYMRTLRRYYKLPDRSAFDRMVDNKGSQFPGVSAEEWTRRIRATCLNEDVRKYYAKRCDTMLASLKKLEKYR